MRSMEHLAALQHSPALGQPMVRRHAPALWQSVLVRTERRVVAGGAAHFHSGGRFERRSSASPGLRPRAVAPVSCGGRWDQGEGERWCFQPSVNFQTQEPSVGESGDHPASVPAECRHVLRQKLFGHNCPIGVGDAQRAAPVCDRHEAVLDRNQL